MSDDRLERNSDSESLHADYIRMLQEDAATRIDLDLIIMKLKTLCGDAEGIQDVCTYLRKDEDSFDVERFEQDRPDLYDEYTTTGKSRRVVSFKRSRDY